MRRRGTWEPRPKNAVSSCAQARGFLRVATLPRDAQLGQDYFHQKNTYVLKQLFYVFCRLLPIIQFLQHKVDLAMAPISAFGTEIASRLALGPHRGASKLCAGAANGEGRVAPACAPAPSEQLSTEKHKAFVAVPVFPLLVTSLFSHRRFYFDAQA